ncbi:MAG: BON domain-containing protein [Williamsia sp.]|nr:BON domain-containing protein [Williamsia sp.]
MKHLFGNLLLAAVLCTAGTGFLSCKSKTDTGSATDTSATMTAPADTSSMTQAPPTISADDSLNMKLQDATKDYPDVTATAANGVVTLTGNISRAKLPKLMQAVQNTHPKKVTNNLTIK